jgi:hypothetical protein
MKQTPPFSYRESDRTFSENALGGASGQGIFLRLYVFLNSTP